MRVQEGSAAVILVNIPRGKKVRHGVWAPYPELCSRALKYLKYVNLFVLKVGHFRELSAAPWCSRREHSSSGEWLGVWGEGGRNEIAHRSRPANIALRATEQPFETIEHGAECLVNGGCSVLDQVIGEQTYQSRNVIALDESTLVIHKDTAVNYCTET